MSGFFASSVVFGQRPTGLIPKCGACGLYRKCRSPKMKPYGDGRKRVLVVGEAPGETEDEEGRPFIGKAGQFLREYLEEIDIDLDRDCWTTNALICRPPENKTPDAKQVSYCRPNLQATVKALKPRVVLLLGKVALASAIAEHWNDSDVGGLERWVGWRMPVKDHWLCPTWHPSYLMRKEDEVMNRMFLEHLREAFNCREKSLIGYQTLIREGDIEVVTDETEACWKIRKIEKDMGWVAVDYETNCIKADWPKGRVYCCSLANRNLCIAYPWTARTKAITERILINENCLKISSNLKMEERWTLREFAHGVKGWGWDTMLAAHCLDNRPGICSLKFQALVKLGISIYNRHVDPFLEAHRGPYNRIHEIDLRHLLYYCGMDSFLELRLAMQQRREMGLT